MRSTVEAGRGLVALALLIAAGTAAAQENVALNRPFVCSSDVMDGWTGLVDGVSDSDSGPGCFATSDEVGFPKSVTIDLQRPCSVNRIAVHNSVNGNTRGIAIYCSQDGQQFEKLREFIFPQAQPIVLNHRFNDRPAQFVRVEFANTWGGGLGGDNVIFVREVEVFGTPTGGAPVTAPPPQPIGDPLVLTRDVRLFKRWALAGDRPLSIVAFGDSLAAISEESWPTVVAEGLQFARPEGAQVTVSAVAHPGMTPDAGSGDVTEVIDAAPDVVLVSFGTDMVHWDGEDFRAGLGAVVGRLLAETDAVVVLVGPVPRDEEMVNTARRALAQMERTAELLGVAVVRTEAALLAEGLSVEDVLDDDGELSEATRRVIATSVLELLVQP